MNQPTLYTKRLKLRPMKPEDIEYEQAFYQTDRSQYVGGQMHPADVWRVIAARIGHWALRGYGSFAIEERETSAYCGHVGPWHPVEWPEPEIAWSVMGNAEGRGIAFEAAIEVRAWAYEKLGWNTTISMIDPTNHRSIALAKRLGATFERDFDHHKFGKLQVWRHPSSEALAYAS
ncbi:MAG: GNAT family N-acetyltransferase [Pseudomonadota bacterium]